MSKKYVLAMVMKKGYSEEHLNRKIAYATSKLEEQNIEGEFSFILVETRKGEESFSTLEYFITALEALKEADGLVCICEPDIMQYISYRATLLIHEAAHVHGMEIIHFEKELDVEDIDPPNDDNDLLNQLPPPDEEFPDETENEPTVEE